MEKERDERISHQTAHPTNKANTFIDAKTNNREAEAQLSRLL